jgi:hypothetical protein
MAKTINELHDEMVSEYQQFREHLGLILEAVSRVQNAGVDDDLCGELEALEGTVHKVRTGGLLGGGAKGHQSARKKWLDAQQQ